MFKNIMDQIVTSWEITHLKIAYRSWFLVMVDLLSIVSSMVFLPQIHQLWKLCSRSSAHFGQFWAPNPVNNYLNYHVQKYYEPNRNQLGDIAPQNRVSQLILSTGRSTVESRFHLWSTILGGSVSLLGQNFGPPWFFMAFQTVID